VPFRALRERMKFVVAGSAGALRNC